MITIAGGRIDILVEPELRGFDAKLGSGLRSAVGVASGVGKGIGLAIAGGTALAGIGLKNIIELGIDYTGRLNEMQAVTGSTGTQMAAVGAKAKALGADLSLPATSAAGAAAAMLELSKGGLSVQQSMDAAKGTLQLAAAASIDGAAAAEIQSSALNQFGLAAGDAGHVADVLANTANAASGSITDIALALKYVGPVAKSVGVSIDDTATVIGLLANKGIQADSAGTALRGMLASLASPSKEASKALNELGIKAFDGQGKFVGFKSVIEQLTKAQGRMTQEQFASNAATAFGREPLAAIVALAEGGGPAFDDMAKAVGRQGGAAEVASAKMKGLGGAWEAFKSQLETAGIAIFEVIDGPLEAAVRKGSQFVERFTPAVVKGFENAIAAGQLFGPALGQAIESRASAVGTVVSKLVKPIGDGLKDALGAAINVGLGAVRDFVDVVRAGASAVEPFAQSVGKLVSSFARGDGPIGAVGTALGIAYDIVKAGIAIVAPAAGLIADLVSAFADLPGPIQTAALAILALKFGPTILDALKSAFTSTAKEADEAAKKTDEAAKKTGLFSRAASLVTAPVRLVASGVSTAAGSVRQFGQEMAVQRALATQAGESVSHLGSVTAAYHTSAIGAVGAMRGFTDQAAAIRAGAAAVEQPISRMGAAMSVLVERSSALSSARAAFQQTFDTVAKASDRAALAVGIAAESIGTKLHTAAIRTGLEVDAAASKVGSFGDKIRSGFSSAVDSVVSKTTSFVGAVKTIPTAVGVAALSVQERLTGAVTKAGDAFAALPGKIAALPTAIGVGVVGAFERIPGAVTSGVSALGRFGAAAAGAASAAGSLLKSAGQGLVAALGGPWGVAIAGATLGLGLIAAAQARAAQKAREHEQGVSSLAQALRDSNNAITENVRAIAAKRLGEVAVGESGQNMLQVARELGISQSDLTSAYLGSGTAMGSVRSQLDAMLPKGEAYINQLGIVRTGEKRRIDLAALLIKSLGDVGGEFGEAEKKNRDLDEAIKNGSASMLEATDSGRTFGAAMKVLASNTSSANDKARALKDALDALSGGQISLEASQARLNERFASLGEVFGATVDKTKGFGDALITAAGRIDVTTENGRKLRDGLEGIVESTTDVATRTFEMTGSIDAAGVVAEKARGDFIKMAEQMGLSKEQAGHLADSMGLIPRDIQTLVALRGADPVKQELTLVKGMIDRVPGQKEVFVRSLTEEARKKLEEFGFKVETLKDGRIKVTANTETAGDQLDRFVSQPRTAVVNVVTRGTGNRSLALGGVLEPFAAGGIKPLRPMSGGVAEIVPANTWRVIGDRMRGDEAFIPINRSLRSVSLLEETARRMGFDLLRRFAGGGVAMQSRVATPTVARQVTTGPVINNTITVRDDQDAFTMAEVYSRRTAFQMRIPR